MILRARAVVTIDGPPIAGGAVAVQGSRVVEVGPWREVRTHHTGEVIDLGERVILPGLINAHCHLDYTGMRGSIPPPASFAEWIRAINERKAAWTTDDYARSIAHGFEEAQSFGTTALLNFVAIPEVLAEIGKARLRTWWFAEMIDVRKPVSASAVAGQMRSAVRDDPLSEPGLAPHAPFTASAKLYREAAAQGLPLSTHLAESRAERLMYHDARGELFDFLQSLGRPTDDCGGRTPLRYALEEKLIGEGWIITHLNELTDEDLALLARGPKFHIVHCPRSRAYFRHSSFRFPELQGLGFNICLGTDSLASAPDLNLFEEMRAFQRNFPDVSSHEVLSMVTAKPGAALGCADELGRIGPGTFADFIALPAAGPEENLYDEIVAFAGCVDWMMLDGKAREFPS